MVAGLLLCLAAAPQQGGFADFERWVHEGLPAPVDAEERAAMDGVEALACDLALLVPSRTSGIVVDEARRQEAAARVLARFEEIPDAYRDLALARLRGHLDADGAAAVRALLAGIEEPRRAGPFSLLEATPLSRAREALYDHVADEDAPADERGVLAERLMLADGRAALERLRPTIHPEAAPQYMRRVLAAWRQIVRPEDLPWLESLARETEGYAGQFALQLWAMEETDPEARWRAFGVLLDGPPEFRGVALDALARQGPHARIAGALREMTEAPDRSLQRLARRMLPVFADHSALLEEYRSRAADASINVRGDWMRDLAASPLMEAQEEAARWLVQGGWSTGSRALVVTRHLQGSEALDPLLPALLEHPEIPLQVRFPIAEARAPHHPAARDYLRRALERESELLARQAVRALAGAGDPDDLALFRRVATDRSYPMGARVAAVNGLAGSAEWDALAAVWSAEPPQSYELAVAFLRVMAHAADPDQRAWAVDAALGGMDFTDVAERRGLRVALWQEMADGAPVDDPALLDRQAIALLETAEPVTGEGESWPGLRALVGAYGELSALMRARARSMRTDLVVSWPLRTWTPDVAAPEALFFASLLAADGDPELSAGWWAALQERAPTVPDRLRVLGAWATRGPLDARRVEAWVQLERRGEDLRSSPRVLAEAFAPEGRGWTLFQDRIAERRLLDQARLAAPDARATLLRPLLTGWVSPAVLTAASDLLATGSPQDRALANDLAARAADLAPLDATVHVQRARLAAEAQDAEAERAAWAMVLRLVPTGHALHEEAQDALQIR